MQHPKENPPPQFVAIFAKYRAVRIVRVAHPLSIGAVYNVLRLPASLK